jgi:hypothetical protein
VRVRDVCAIAMCDPPPTRYSPPRCTILARRCARVFDVCLRVDVRVQDGHLKFKKDDEIVLLNKRKGSQW